MRIRDILWWPFKKLRWPFRREKYIVKRMPVGFERSGVSLSRNIFVDMCCDGDLGKVGARPNVFVSELKRAQYECEDITQITKA